MGVGLSLLKLFLLLRASLLMGQNVTIYGPAIAKPLFQGLRTSFMLTRPGAVEYAVAQADVNSYLALGQPVVVDKLDNFPNASLTIPMFGFPLVIVYNLDDTLLLTQSALVDIFLGRITRWNHGNLTFINPNITLPDQPIILVLGSLLDRFIEGLSVLAGESLNVSSLSVNNTLNAGPKVCSKVKATPYSLGFSWMSDALTTGSRLALLQNREGFFVSPVQGAPIALSEYHTAQQVAALTEIVTPHNMRGRLAWPLMGIFYFLVPDNFRTCLHLQIIQDFVSLVMFRSSTMDMMMELEGWQPAKSLLLLDQSLGIIEQQVDYNDLLFGVPCGDSNDADENPDHTVGCSTDLFPAMLKMLGPYTAEVDSTLELSPVDNITLLLGEMVRGEKADLDVDLVFTWESVIASYPQLFSVPAFMGSVVPFVNFGSLPPVLSVPILADIFAGVITHWNDAQIEALNPNLVLPDQPIIVFAAPILAVDDITAVFSQMLSKYSPTFLWSQVNKTVASGLDAVDLVKFTPFSIGYSFDTAVEDAITQVPRLLGFNNKPILFSVESLSACWISRLHSDCWPMATPLSVALRRPEEAHVSCQHQQHSVRFVDWMLRRTVGLSEYLVPNLDPTEDLKEAEYCGGRSLLVTEPEPLALYASAKNAVYILSALCMLWATFQAIALAVSRRRSELKSASVFFSLLAVIGVFLILLAPLLIVQDDPSMAGCGSSVWFLALGFSLCYGSLFAKLFRLYTIFTSRKLVVPRLSNRRLMGFVACFLVVDFILLLIYNIHTPPEPFVFSAHVYSPEDLVTGEREFTLNMCSFHADSPVLYIILGVKCLVALSGSGMAFFIRQVDRRFSATAALGWSFYNMFLTVLIITLILVFFLPDDDLESTLFIPVFGGLWIMFVTLIALTLDSNVLLACKDFSRPLRKLLGTGSKDSGSKGSNEQKASGTDPRSEPNQSGSRTIFVVNREMFPSKYDELDNVLLEKILEELNFQRLAVRRALVNKSATSTTSTSSTDSDVHERHRGSTADGPHKFTSKNKSGLGESPRAFSKPQEKPSIDIAELRANHAEVEMSLQSSRIQ